jgi:hypothetical protein
VLTSLVIKGRSGEDEQRAEKEGAVLLVSAKIVPIDPSEVDFMNNTCAGQSTPTSIPSILKKPRHDLQIPHWSNHLLLAL